MYYFRCTFQSRFDDLYSFFIDAHQSRNQNALHIQYRLLPPYASAQPSMIHILKSFYAPYGYRRALCRRVGFDACRRHGTHASFTNFGGLAADICVRHYRSGSRFSIFLRGFTMAARFTFWCAKYMHHTLTQTVTVMDGPEGWDESPVRSVVSQEKLPNYVNADVVVAIAMMFYRFNE